MAYQDDPLDPNQQQAVPGKSSVIAGNSGVGGAGAPSASAGSGFTNLQTYLSANKGEGGFNADQIVAGGQEGFDGAVKTADNLAAGVTTAGVAQANAGVEGETYTGPTSAGDVKGFNDLDKAYTNATDYSNNYANDYGAQKSNLQKANNYGGGFAALDTFIGRQDGRERIQANNTAQVAGLKNESGGFKGTSKAQADISGAIAGGQAAAAGNTATRVAAETSAAAEQARAAADKAAQPAPTSWGPGGIASQVDYPWGAPISVDQNVAIDTNTYDTGIAPTPIADGNPNNTILGGNVAVDVGDVQNAPAAGGGFSGLKKKLNNQR